MVEDVLLERAAPVAVVEAVVAATMTEETVDSEAVAVPDVVVTVLDAAVEVLVVLATVEVAELEADVVADEPVPVDI